jgi:hypothetical protein
MTTDPAFCDSKIKVLFSIVVVLFIFSMPICAENQHLGIKSTC